MKLPASRKQQNNLFTDDFTKQIYWNCHFLNGPEILELKEKKNVDTDLSFLELLQSSRDFCFISPGQPGKFTEPLLNMIPGPLTSEVPLVVAIYTQYILGKALCSKAYCKNRLS